MYILHIPKFYEIHNGVDTLYNSYGKSKIIYIYMVGFRQHSLEVTYYTYND